MTLVPVNQLEKWATPRLLRYFKAQRKRMINMSKDEYIFTSNSANSVEWRERYMTLIAHVSEVKKLLNGREHVPTA
jgi:hypothetical protein